MDCDRIRPELSAFADGELTGSPLAARVENHLASCLDCRDKLESWREAGRRLRAEDATRDPAGDVLAAIRDARRPRRGRRSFRVGIRAAVAAAVVVAAALSFGPVQAQREAALMVDLDGRVRVAASEELASITAAQIELAALFMSLRALERDEPAARDLAIEAESLAARAAVLEARLRELCEAIAGDSPLETAPGRE